MSYSVPIKVIIATNTYGAFSVIVFVATQIRITKTPYIVYMRYTHGPSLEMMVF